MTTTRHRISVIGTGYLGATHAVCMAALGHEVLAVDVDAGKIAALASGRLPFYEPKLGAMLLEMGASGRLRFTTDIAEAGAFADVHFVCVGTPPASGSDAADLTYVRAAVDGLAPHLRDGALIVGKSTVPVGTAAELTDRLARSATAQDVQLAWNPEFLREGYAVDDTLAPDRLVFGVGSFEAECVLRSVYEPIISNGVTPVVVTDLATAELVKVAANGYLATKISYINAMAEVCERAGGDIMALAEALSHDARIGGRFLRPGLGFGGGCLPKDIRAFRHRAHELGADEAVSFLREIDAINLRCRVRTVEAVRCLVDSLAGARVAALGAAFKPNSDDIRDAPALAVASALHAAGADVVVYDPQAMDNARRACPQLSYAASTLEAITGADVVVILTEWDEFRTVNPVVAARVAARLAVVDARHALDAEAWRAAGWRYRALGTRELAPTDRSVAELVS